MKKTFLAGALCLLSFASLHAQECNWRGIPIAPEDRCATYNRDDYRYPQSVELEIIAAQGGEICSPYTGECFESRTETDIEHIIALSEAHDSGLCAATDEVKRQFASDLLNLTLASPALNRYEKSDRDAADWLPERNRCWFAAQIVAVRLAYGLTIDQREADALEATLSACGWPEEIYLYFITQSTPVNAYACADATCATVANLPAHSAVMARGAWRDVAVADDTCWMEITHAREPAYLPCSAVTPIEPCSRRALPPTEEVILDSYAGLTCGEIYERYGEANFGRDHPAYSARRDRDDDGIACER